MSSMALPSGASGTGVSELKMSREREKKEMQDLNERSDLFSFNYVIIELSSIILLE